ncbi:MAG: DUF4340 domain-containing protein [Anaerolineae bacterium]|nr:DUF4340 domain-containing protein [Anaerolineae bacterium]
MNSHRTWIVLAALALVAALAYYLLEVRGVADTPSEVTYVWDLDVDQVVGIRMTDAALGLTTSLEKDADGNWWAMTNQDPTRRPARAIECVSLAYGLATLQVQRTIDDPPEGELEAYGLAAPNYTVVLHTDDGQTLRLEIGVFQESGLYYARRAGEQAVLLIPDYAANEAITYLHEPPFDVPSVEPGVPIIGPTPSGS